METNPTLTKIQLSKEYKFMYQNFTINTQHDLYLMLEEANGMVNALKFDFIIFKYGYPNDEGLGAHPMANFGLTWYDFFHVKNSQWIFELENQRTNKSYKLFEKYEHYIITFKDITLDIICSEFKEIQLTKDQIYSLINNEINLISID